MYYICSYSTYISYFEIFRLICIHVHVLHYMYMHIYVLQFISDTITLWYNVLYIQGDEFKNKLHACSGDVYRESKKLALVIPKTWDYAYVHVHVCNRIKRVRGVN